MKKQQTLSKKIKKSLVVNHAGQEPATE